MEAPEPYVPKARYALETLLRPLSLVPIWTAEAPDLYYGSGPPPPSAAVHLPLQASTVRYFAQQVPYDASLVFRTADLPVLFGTPEAPDLIASAFFLLSGWDEHVTVERDEHARFCHRHALLREIESETAPLVDQYRDLLAARLQAAGVRVRLRKWGDRDWAFLPTFDIDYLREWRPGTVLREGRRRPWAVVRGMMTGADAFRDGLHNLIAALSANAMTGSFFFKASDRSAYDPAYRRSEREVARLVRMVREQGSEVGLHPSYYASTHAQYLHEERTRLETLTGERASLVRQHYLRYELPTTSRLQADEGFQIDSTLGYADHEGFRRATCLPFQIFDPVRNGTLDLWEMPLCFMDSTMMARRCLGPDESADVLARLMVACRAAGGMCVALWHNILWEEGREGWPEHLEWALQHAEQNGARVGGLAESLDAWMGRESRALGSDS